MQALNVVRVSLCSGPWQDVEGGWLSPVEADTPGSDCQHLCPLMGPIPGRPGSRPSAGNIVFLALPHHDRIKGPDVGYGGPPPCLHCQACSSSLQEVIKECNDRYK